MQTAPPLHASRSAAVNGRLTPAESGLVVHLLEQRASYAPVEPSEKVGKTFSM